MILQTSEPGILLAGSFKKTSKTLKTEIASFENKLSELQKKLQLSSFVSAMKTVKDVITVKVIGVKGGPPPQALDPAAPTASAPRSVGWSGKAAKQVTADLKAELGWGKKK